MITESSSIKNVDEYIACYPEEVQELLTQMRTTILKAAPQAEEVISYKMPAYKLNGMLVYFAAYKNHIGFYPTPSGIKKYQEELAVFKNSKGAVQFPFNQTLPIELITRIVQFRAKENLEKAHIKPGKKSKTQ